MPEVKLTSWEKKKKKTAITHFGGPDDQRCSDWEEEKMLRRGGAKSEGIKNHRGIPTRERVSLW